MKYEAILDFCHEPHTFTINEARKLSHELTQIANSQSETWNIYCNDKVTGIKITFDILLNRFQVVLLVTEVLNEYEYDNAEFMLLDLFNLGEHGDSPSSRVLQHYIPNDLTVSLELNTDFELMQTNY